MTTTRFIVLAAGKGTRMKSALPKVLHPLAGKPLLGHVLDTASTLDPASINVVIGHGADKVQSTITNTVNWALQSEQLGTGHAVLQGLDGIEDDDMVVVTYGDIPLTRASTYQKLLDAADEQTIGLLTLVMEDAQGYGRILREAGQVTGVVEEKDATQDQKAIREVNCGVVALRGEWLRTLLGRIGNDNAQGEYYLTDIFGLAVREGVGIETVHPDHAWEVDGVNSRVQLARLERIHQANQADVLMESGVTLHDPGRLDVRGSLTTGTDVEIDVNCVFIGNCTLGNHVSIGPGCVISDSHVADHSVVHAHSIIEQSTIAEHCSVGPFARLRPRSVLANNAKVGNFVETKNAQVGPGSKISHLSYVGDAELGRDVNVGAGTITCNYDGANKHLTQIGDDAFIGSNSALVAPVEVGAGATVGAGSTITRAVPDKALSLTRAKQSDIADWQRPRKSS